MAKNKDLNRRRILETALGLADEEGLQAVTMRQVARRLDAGTMSLYYYVPSKGELLEGIVDFVFEQVKQAPDNIQGWADRVVSVSLSFRRVALAHPVVLPLIASGSVSGPAVLQSTEGYLGAILQEGFDPQTTAQVHRATTSYVVGYLSLELGGFFGSLLESYRRGGLELEDGAAEEYPRLSEIAPHLSAWEPEQEFEAGLRRLLEGFHNSLASGPC